MTLENQVGTDGGCANCYSSTQYIQMFQSSYRIPNLLRPEIVVSRTKFGSLLQDVCCFFVIMGKKDRGPGQIPGVYLQL